MRCWMNVSYAWTPKLSPSQCPYGHIIKILVLGDLPVLKNAGLLQLLSYLPAPNSVFLAALCSTRPASPTIPSWLSLSSSSSPQYDNTCFGQPAILTGPLVRLWSLSKPCKKAACDLVCPLVGSGKRPGAASSYLVKDHTSFFSCLVSRLGRPGRMNRAQDRRQSFPLLRLRLGGIQLEMTWIEVSPHIGELVGFS